MKIIVSYSGNSYKSLQLSDHIVVTIPNLQFLSQLSLNFLFSLFFFYKRAPNKTSFCMLSHCPVIRSDTHKVNSSLIGVVHVCDVCVMLMLHLEAKRRSRKITPVTAIFHICLSCRRLCIY